LSRGQAVSNTVIGPSSTRRAFAQGKLQAPRLRRAVENL
jgi:hypothetical protein